MSNGPTQRYKYEMENDMVTRVTLQPETQAITVGTVGNPEPAAARTPGIPTAKVSLNDGDIGVRPRAVIGKWVTVAADSGYTVGTFTKLTILTKAAKATFIDGATVNYLGGTVEIDRQQPEQVV